MAIGRMPGARQGEMFIAASAVGALDNPFYAALDKLLRKSGFDEFAEETCREFYAARPSFGRVLPDAECGLVPGHRDYGEWLYDVTWLEYERERDGLIEAHLVAECEWGNFRKIVYDFEKLLLARACVRLMIFNGFSQAQSEEIAEQLAERVRMFNGSRAEDAWLLAAWEGTPENWSFRYFTITPATGTLRAFDTSGNPSPS